MTVSSQVKQAIAGLKGAQASFETFALETQNQQAKQHSKPSKLLIRLSRGCINWNQKNRNTRDSR